MARHEDESHGAGGVGARLDEPAHNGNDGVTKGDLTTGFVRACLLGLFNRLFTQIQTLSGAVQSVEDHGYIFDLGISGVSGFLSLKDLAKGSEGPTTLHIGQLLEVSVSKLSSNGRTCTLSVDPKRIATSFVGCLRYVLTASLTLSPSCLRSPV